MLKLLVGVLKYKNKQNIRLKMAVLNLAKISDDAHDDIILDSEGRAGLEESMDFARSDTIVEDPVFLTKITYESLLKEINKYRERANLNMEVEVFFPSPETGKKVLLRYTASDMLKQPLSILLAPIQDYLKHGRYITTKELHANYFGKQYGRSGFIDNTLRKAKEMKFTKKTYDTEVEPEVKNSSKKIII